jgi:hypothetical protein
MVPLFRKTYCILFPNDCDPFFFSFYYLIPSIGRPPVGMVSLLQIFELIPGNVNPSYLGVFPPKYSPTPCTMAAEPGTDEVAIDARLYFRIFKSGRIERHHLSPVLPAGLDEATGVASKDVVLDSNTGLSVRVYLPKLQEPSKKLPVLVYSHGGGFVIELAFSATYHNYQNPLAAAPASSWCPSSTAAPRSTRALRGLLGRAPVGGVGAGRVDLGVR